MNRIALATCLCLCACGASSVGGGTQRLFVTADLDGDGSTAGSRVVVVVRKGDEAGALLNDAEVVLRGGKLGRTVVPFDETRNDYRLSGFRWEPALRLEVTREREWLDATIDVPGATLVVSPLDGANFAKADKQPLIVEWQDEHHVASATTTVHLQRAGIDRTVPPGSVSLVLEPTELLRTTDEKLTIERRVGVDLFGGALNSRFTAGTSNTVTFNVE